MITTASLPEPYKTRYSSTTQVAVADAPLEKGGGAAGFGPHELLEAALATCLNMAVRMEANKRGIAIEAVTSSVSLDRTQADSATFLYQVAIVGQLSPEQRQVLDEAAENCPVRNTLSKALAFRTQRVQ